MRRLIALMGALAGVFALCLGLAAPATAGGPTSVMLVNPGSGEATAIYASSPEYEELLTMIGPGSAKAPAEPSGQREITITWMIHDVTPWQIDRFYPDSEGGPLIQRQEAFPQTGESTPPTQWFRPDLPDSLIDLLTDLGVMGEDVGKSISAPSFPVYVGEDEPTQSPTPAARNPVVVQAATDPATNWWWTLPGLAAGAALAAAAPYALRAWRARREISAEASPRQELIEPLDLNR